MFKFLSNVLKNGLTKPDLTIRRTAEEPYLLRWFVIPRNSVFNCYLHKFCGDDADFALHSHPWYSLSFVLKGAYQEYLVENKMVIRKAGNIIFRRPNLFHRIALVNNKPAWTLFFTGPRISDWFFACPQGKISWTKVVKVEEDGSHSNLGCGE